MNKPTLVFAALFTTGLAAGCKDGAKKADPAPSAPPSSAPLVKEPAPTTEAPPVSGPAFLAPPLGAPDAIAPTTIELVPGMRDTDAKAKGATPGSTSDDWNWKPEIDLKIDKHGVITQLVGKYTPAEIAALKAKWGKPTFGEDYWMGASWLAEIGTNCGSQPPCFVYFMRAPNQQFFGKTPVPPIGLAKLTFDMPRAEITKLFGIEPDVFTATGYGYTLSYDFTDDKLRSIKLSNSTFIDNEVEVAHLTSLWGKPAKLGGDDDALLWVDPAARWAAVFDVGQLDYYPITLWSDLLAKTGPHSIVATSAQLLGQKQAQVGDATRVWPGTEADPTRAISIEPSFGDDELTTSLAFRIDLPEAAVAAHVAKIEKALGKPATVKDDYGDDQSVITTDGLAIQLLAEDWGVTLTVSKAK
jgi:hypothetical protein